MMHICDLNVVRNNCPNFIDIYNEGMGACSHISNGSNHLNYILEIFFTDPQSRIKNESFSLAPGEIVEL